MHDEGDQLSNQQSLFINRQSLQPSHLKGSHQETLCAIWHFAFRPAHRQGCAEQCQVRNANCKLQNVMRYPAPAAMAPANGRDGAGSLSRRSGEMKIHVNAFWY